MPLPCLSHEAGIAAGCRGVDADMAFEQQAGGVVGCGQQRDDGAIAGGQGLADGAQGGVVGEIGYGLESVGAGKRGEIALGEDGGIAQARGKGRLAC